MTTARLLEGMRVIDLTNVGRLASCSAPDGGPPWRALQIATAMVDLVRQSARATVVDRRERRLGRTAADRPLPAPADARCG
jgi:hypothetical protein